MRVSKIDVTFGAGIYVVIVVVVSSCENESGFNTIILLAEEVIG